MYDKCYFCLDQLPKLKKRIHSKLFRKFWRNRGTKEPAYITVIRIIIFIINEDFDDDTKHPTFGRIWSKLNCQALVAKIDKASLYRSTGSFPP